MKKAIAIAVCMMFLVPFSAFGMEMVSDDEMEKVTGQSGVAITLDDLKIYTHNGQEEMWYQTGNAAVGMVYDNESYQMMHVNAITDNPTNAAVGDNTTSASPGRDLQGTYTTFDFYNVDSDGDNEDDAYAPSALTITVKDELDTFAEAGAAGVVGVEIGLPTVEVFTEEGSKDVFGIYATTDGNPLDDNSVESDGTTSANTFSYGKIYSSAGDSTTAILDGKLEIAPLSSYVDSQQP